MNREKVDHFLRRVALVLFCGAVAALILRLVFPPPTDEERRLPAIVRLSGILAQQLDAIFSPIDAKAAVPSRGELEQLRAKFTAEAPDAAPEARPLYATARELSETLLATLDRRADFAERLAASRKVTAATRLDEAPSGGGAAQAAQAKNQHFEGAIRSDWEKAKAPFRSRVDALASELQARERAFLQSTASR